jgi:chromosome segregation ATPase
MDTTIQVVLISSAVGLLTLLINALLNRRRARVEDAGLAEDAQGKELGNLQIIIDEWREHYNALNERTRVTENELQTLRAENAALRAKVRELEDGARLAYDNLRLEIASERVQRIAQTNLIISLTAEVTRLGGVVESQASTISKLRSDLTQSEKRRVELQAALTRAEGEIHLLRAQLDIVRQGQGTCGL